MYHCDANLRRSCNASICSILKSTCFLDYSRIDTGLELPFKEKSVRLDTADIFKQQSFHEKASTKFEAAGKVPFWGQTSAKELKCSSIISPFLPSVVAPSNHFCCLGTWFA